MSSPTPFELSRLYAKGWDAGMRCEPVECDGTDTDTLSQEIVAQAEALNPCSSAPEREKWMEGFTAAVQRRSKGPQRNRRGS